MAQAKLPHKKFPSRRFETTLLNARDTVTDQISLAANRRGFLDVSMQMNAEDLFMHSLRLIRGEWSMGFANGFEQCDFFVTTSRQTRRYSPSYR